MGGRNVCVVERYGRQERYGHTKDIGGRDVSDVSEAWEVWKVWELWEVRGVREVWEV